MKTRKLPSHPRDHDRARVSKALSNVQPVRVMKLPNPDPRRPRYEADIEIAAAIDRSFPAPTNGRKILQAGAEILAALEKVEKSKYRSITQSGLPMERNKPVGEATPDRARRAPEGIQEEPLSHNVGHVRARVRSPMELFEAHANRTAREFDIEKGKAKREDPRYAETRFDKVLNFIGCSGVRWALSRYVEDRISVVCKNTNNGGVKVDGMQASHDRSPFNTTQQFAHTRISKVHAELEKCSPLDRQDLEIFANMMERLQSNYEAPSMEEFAIQRTGALDHKVREGIFCGIMLKVGERLYHIYKKSDWRDEMAMAIAA